MSIRFYLLISLIFLSACSSTAHIDAKTEVHPEPMASKDPPLADKKTSLEWLLPDPSIDSPETTIVMYGSDTCPASIDSKDSFLDGYDLEAPIRFQYRDHSELSNGAQYYGTPSFVLFHEGVAIDIHAGIVSSANDFANDANTQIFNLLLIRNNIIKGDKWKSSNNRRVGIEHETQFEYSAFNFTNLEEFDFSNRSLNYTIFSSALLRGADFTGASLEGTVFAHSDLRDVIFSETQQSELFIVGGICPEGTEALVGMNCDGRFLPLDEE